MFQAITAVQKCEEVVFSNSVKVTVLILYCFSVKVFAYNPSL